jgi:hypothetical protein
MKRRDPDPRSPKEIWDEQHQLLGRDTVVWVMRADELFAAFELLAARDVCTPGELPEVDGVAYMIAGFAVEVLMKALIIQKESGVDSKGQFQLKNHDLLKLADRAGLTISDDEKRLLERLQEYAIWAGRYPIPLASEPMRPRELPGGGFAPITCHFVGQDWDGVRTLVRELKALLPEVKYGPPWV